MVHQWESGNCPRQYPVGCLDMGNEFPEDPKTSGTEAVITVSRQVIEISGGEEIVKFDVCNRNTFYKDLGFPKDDGVIHSPTRARLI
ncbi:MAG: hypothetical protein RM347_032940 [Nostoc sp. ChiQUE02]|uniref:hypothetical protein n=1 Tax=Nostoc sp. ChiQUE02 TaxID=3075377 RepID=UPI002AD3F5FE|nr:hypothetical protein [Nostoc sp. ChiQUE02]MDZ8231506.1 hypothetical protein [Nostoc sp. ChiQUE02]